MSTNVSDLLKQAITANKADGLCNSYLECGCSLEDLCPCGEPDLYECTLGWSGPPPTGESCDEWFYACKADADNAKENER
jgi:hypothetical protein